MDDLTFSVWVWEGSSWRVLASYRTRAEAEATIKHAADPPETTFAARIGSAKDEYVREHCTDRMAPIHWRQEANDTVH